MDLAINWGLDFSIVDSILITMECQLFLHFLTWKNFSRDILRFVSKSDLKQTTESIISGTSEILLTFKIELFVPTPQTNGAVPIKINAFDNTFERVSFEKDDEFESWSIKALSLEISSESWLFDYTSDLQTSNELAVIQLKAIFGHIPCLKWFFNLTLHPFEKI